MLNKIFYVVVAFLLFNNNTQAQTTFFVSPKGNDANRGTQNRPFASVNMALAEARKTSGNIVINLLGGIYRLSQPVVITSEDSREENESLTITNFKNQKVTISGGVALNLNWKEYANGIWQAKVTQNLVFDQLFVNGQLQRMARYPNYDSTARFLGGTAADALNIERVAGWKSPEGGYVHALHRFEWGDFHYIITGKNNDGELALEGGWQNNRRMGMHEKHPGTL